MLHAYWFRKAFRYLILLLPAGAIYGKIVGISQEQAQELIDITIKHGQIPEPVRVAHLIASGVVKGESSGKV